jgi:hypothetical protein
VNTEVLDGRVLRPVDPAAVSLVAGWEVAFLRDLDGRWLLTAGFFPPDNVKAVNLGLLVPLPDNATVDEARGVLYDDQLVMAWGGHRTMECSAQCPACVNGSADGRFSCRLSPGLLSVTPGSHKCVIDSEHAAELQAEWTAKLQEAAQAVQYAMAERTRCELTCEWIAQLAGKLA